MVLLITWGLLADSFNKFVWKTGRIKSNRASQFGSTYTKFWRTTRSRAIIGGRCHVEETMGSIRFDPPSTYSSMRQSKIVHQNNNNYVTNAVHLALTIGSLSLTSFVPTSPPPGTVEPTFETSTFITQSYSRAHQNKYTTNNYSIYIQITAIRWQRSLQLARKKQAI